MFVQGCAWSKEPRHSLRSMQLSCFPFQPAEPPGLFQGCSEATPHWKRELPLHKAWLQVGGALLRREGSGRLFACCPKFSDRVEQ